MLDSAAAVVQPDRVVVFSDMSCVAGGAEAIALLSAQLIAAAGVPVTFITGDSAEACPLDRSRIEVIALGGVPVRHSPGTLGAAGIYNPAAARLVRRFLARRDTPRTVYHLHNWSKILSPAIFGALRPVASRLFISAHDFALVCPNLAYSNYRKGGETCSLRPLGPACLATHCDRQSYLHKLWRVARTAARHWAMDLHHSQPLVGIIHPDMAPYLTRGGVPEHCLRILRNPVRPYTSQRVRAEDNDDLFFVGRVVHEKGVDLAAEAARLVGRRLRVIGDGPMREELARRFPEVVFEGWRTHAQIGALITGARALVLPSRLPETFTLVAHEAMRSGIPVVAFADVDCREAAAIGAAVVVPPREAASLAAGLRLLDDDAAAARMSQAAFDHAARFSNTMESWRDGLLRIYAELPGLGAMATQPGEAHGDVRHAPSFEAATALRELS